MGRTGCAGLDFLLYGAAAAAPSVAALLTAALGGGRAEVRAFLARSFTPRLSGGCLALAVVLPLLQFLLPWLLSCAVAGASLTPARLSGSEVVVILWALVAEGGGGRGLLQGALTQRLPARWVPPAVGAIWALWHYHFYLAGRMETPFLLLAASCILDSYLYDWLWRRGGGNLLPAMLYHCTGNGFIHLFAPVSASGSSVFAALLPLAIALAEGATLAVLDR